jgi:hypothetical protein
MMQFCWIGVISLLISGQTEGAMKDIDTTGPENTYVLPGEEAILTCKTKYKFASCLFFHIASTNGYSLSPEITGYEDRTILFEDGQDPEKKTCGIRITKVKEEQNGVWRCDITANVDGEPKKGQGFANITVIRAPKTLTMEVNGVANGELKVNYPRDQNEQVKCTAMGGRPAPKFEWFLGGKLIEGVDQTLSQSTVVHSDGTTDYSQTISFRATQNHNGKTISCVAVQRGYSDQDKEQGLNSITKTMDVSFKPVTPQKQFTFYGMEVGQQGTIKVNFQSHPKPDNVEWHMHDQQDLPIIAPAESADSRYSALEIRDGPSEGYFTAELVINEIQQRDAETSNRLIVRNALGETEYPFTIGIGSPQPVVDAEGSGTVTIIVIVLIIIIAIIVTFIIARRQGLLCFGDPPTSQEDTEKAVEKEGIEGIDSETGKHDTETDGDGKQSLTSKVTNMMTAMKNTVGGKKEKYSDVNEDKQQDQDEGREEPEENKEEHIVYANLDKSAMSEGTRPVANVENEKMEYAEIIPQAPKE